MREKLSNQLVNIKRGVQSDTLLVHVSPSNWLKIRALIKTLEKELCWKNDAQYFDNYISPMMTFNQVDRLYWTCVGLALKEGCLCVGECERSKLLCHFYKHFHYSHSIYIFFLSSYQRRGVLWTPTPSLKRSMVGAPVWYPLHGDRLTGNIFVGLHQPHLGMFPPLPARTWYINWKATNSKEKKRWEKETKLTEGCRGEVGGRGMSGRKGRHPYTVILHISIMRLKSGQLKRYNLADQIRLIKRRKL